MPLSRKEQRAGTVITFLAILLLSIYIIFSVAGVDSEEMFLLLAGSATIVVGFFCFLITRKYRRENKLTEIDYLNIGTQRYILGLFMIFYGVPKLFGNFFDYQLFALDSKLTDVSEFELAWYYFGKNRWQELFAGIMEFVPGLLLLHRRTYYIASLILLPVTAQVFILNLFFKIGGITFPAATVLLACNLYIIYSQKESIVQFFKSLSFSRPQNLGSKTHLIIRILKFGGIALVLLLIFGNVKRAFFKSDYQRKYEKLVGIYSLEGMRKNNADYSPTTDDSAYYKDLYIEKQSRWNMLRRFNNKTDAFILSLNTRNDSVRIYINKGGAGDDPDIIDSVTCLKGIYQSNKDILTISGVQQQDTLELAYRKQKIRPKQWFW
jgi:hypothetical protein